MYVLLLCFHVVNKCTFQLQAIVDFVVNTTVSHDQGQHFESQIFQAWSNDIIEHWKTNSVLSSTKTRPNGINAFHVSQVIQIWSSCIHRNDFFLPVDILFGRTEDGPRCICQCIGKSFWGEKIVYQKEIEISGLQMKGRYDLLSKTLLPTL